MPGRCLSKKGFRELAALQPPIYPGSYPRSSPGKIVLLTSSGRRLGYDEYVDTSVPSHQLRNVVLLPGIPGTRLFTHPSVQQRGFVPSWRLVVLERPGIGLSDPPSANYTYTDFVSDFWEFCALLGLRRVAVIGFSSGTPFATAIACVQPPSSTTSAAATATVNAHTNTNTFKSTNNNSITTTHIGSLNSSAPTSSAKPSSITATTPCCCADDALSAALLATPAPTAATSAAADSTAAGAAAPRAVLGPAATEAVTATTVTSTVTATAAAVPTLQPLHNQALSTAQGQTEPGQGLVEGVALVSAIGPPNTPNKGRGMALVFRFGFWACAHAPSIVGWMVRVKASALRRRPLNVLRKSFAPYNAKADVAVLKRPEVERMFLESTLELYGRFQEDAVIREKLLFAARPWGFNIAACGLPVAIWQGAQDRGCTAAMATYLSEQMGPKARVHVVPEQGHLLYFDVWHEVVDWLNGLART